MGSAATGRIAPLSAAQIKSSIIDEETSKALEAEMNAEVKKKVAYQDFSLKSIDVKETKQKEQLIIQSLQKGELPAEIIKGEIKLQFEDAIDLLDVPAKNVPFLAINIPNFTAEGKNVQTLNTRPIINYAETKRFSTAVRIPFINKDKNKISDLLQIDIFLQASQTQITPGDAVFIGECNFGWKQLLTNDQWNEASYNLTDEEGRCKLGNVTGNIKIFAKWIPAGHQDSKFDEQGGKKGEPLPSSAPIVPSKREQI